MTPEVLGFELGGFDDPGEAVEACIRLFDSVLDSSPDVTFVLDRDQRYVGIWGSWIEENGTSREDYLGKTSWDIFGVADKDHFEELNERVLAGEHVVYERWFEVPWGPVYYQTVLTPLRDEKGAILGIVGIARDVTKLKRTEESLEHLAAHDPLTGLPNRRSFENAVGRAVARAQREQPSSVLFIDVDNFKLCNDALGHSFGDRILQRIAHALDEEVRAPDMVARLGGDEFGALLEQSGLPEARRVADRMRGAVRGVEYAEEFGLDLSIGVTAVAEDSTFEQVITGADTAMYAAKRSKEKHVVVS